MANEGMSSDWTYSTGKGRTTLPVILVLWKKMHAQCGFGGGCRITKATLSHLKSHANDDSAEVHLNTSQLCNVQPLMDYMDINHSASPKGIKGRA